MSSNYEHYGLSKVPSVRRVGRPKKWETVEELEEQIESYFKSCFIPKMRQRKIKTEDGFDYVDEPVLNSEGEQVLIQIQPFTITGLAIALNTTRDTLLDYETKPENAEFSDTIKNAKQIVQNYAESFLFNGKNATGAIFNLKNNYGWVDRRETDLTSKNERIQAGVIEAKAADILEDESE